MTHELVHMAFPSLPDDQHWMEEGLSTYIEPVARVQAGELPAKRIWADMVHDMPKGEPRSDDHGLDQTHTWGRTYWGGAMFCLAADVAIRKQTADRKGLRDALRAIVAAGGTIDHDWPLPQALEVGDKATGTTVLMDLYRKWGQSPETMDLDALWRDLGIVKGEGGLKFCRRSAGQGKGFDHDALIGRNCSMADSHKLGGLLSPEHNGATWPILRKSLA